ncbi:uncharacterized protein LOC142825176 [Pelodiscus sinensis]|uniref:uncharacterized protein LOC142825176 n=1 Tax=Pelodiscus sinensis TaxID=13735 RepID=UPI003F6AC205
MQSRGRSPRGSGRSTEVGRRGKPSGVKPSVTSNDMIAMPALGRPFQLGMLYDCRDDALIPGITLWDPDMLQNHVDTKPQPKTDSDIITSDTIEDKAKALNVTASLKASFLGGLITVDGSARYLSDTKSSQHQARVVLQYSTTTKFEQLTMKHLEHQNVACPEVFEQGTATHVVTAVLYGAQAFFVFDQEVSSSEDVQEIQEDLQVLIKKLVSIEGQGDLKMDEKEKANIEKFSCKFHGDFVLETNPTTYQDAMKIYSTLPTLLGENGEKAVPVRVWLCPLTKLDSKAQMVHEINTALIFNVQTALEQLTELNMRCNDLEKSLSARTFPEIRKKMQQFKDLCNQYKQTFQKELTKTIPSIRRGRAIDDALMNILIRKEKSPFSNQCLLEFLDKKEEEMKLVESCLTTFKKVKIVSSKSELNEVLLDPTIEFVVSFTFTSLQDEEQYIAELEFWFQTQMEKKTGDPKRTRYVSKKPISRPCVSPLPRFRKTAKSFSDFASVNMSNGKTQFIVASVLNKNIVGASIYLYEHGKQINTTFEPPSKPPPLLIGGVRHDRVQLTLKPAAYGRAEICGYRAEYRLVGQENWVAVNVSNTQETLTVTGLRPNTQYQFRYAAVSKPGLSESSDVSDTVKTLPTSPPGKPAAATVESSALALTWESPCVIGDGVSIREYKVEYKEQAGGIKQKGKDKWLERRTGQKTESCTIEGLRLQTPYRVRVSAVCVDGAVSDPSEETLTSIPKRKETKKQPPHSPKESPVTGDEQPPTSPTKSQTITQHFLKEEFLITKEPPAIYTLLLEKTELYPNASYTKYRLGRETLQIPNKVIMVMGATGSGKTTLINGMVNYVLGVQWEDEFRFKLIHEITNRSQAESQTSEVTAYEVNYKDGFQVPYSLTIIDTPGFGDTRGIDQDKEIIRKVREFFSTPGAIDHIDAVCVVVQASLARLTHAQRYVFDSVLSIFGKNIKDNILILVTFADGQAPPVLEAIKTADVPCAKDAQGNPVHFKFNNSALFACNAGTAAAVCNFDAMFWKMGAMSMQTFFESLGNLDTKSLTLTKEVLRERMELEAAVEGLQPQIKAGLVKLEELRKTQRVLEQHHDDMEANKDFEYEVEKTVPVKQEVTDGYITNCQQCHYTCHYPCSYADDKDKYKCCAMDCSGQCTVCPGKCQWNVHFNQKYQWDYIVVKEKQTYTQLKEKYEKASGEVMTTEKIFEQLFLEYDIVEETVLELIERSSQSLQRLQVIALKPNPLSTPEYVDLLIMSEQQEAKPGYQERIQSLTEVRETAEIITKIANNEKLLPAEQEIYKKRRKKQSRVQLFVDRVKGWFTLK